MKGGAQQGVEDNQPSQKVDPDTLKAIYKVFAAEDFVNTMVGQLVDDAVVETANVIEAVRVDQHKSAQHVGVVQRAHLARTGSSNAAKDTMDERRYTEFLARIRENNSKYSRMPDGELHEVLYNDTWKQKKVGSIKFLEALAPHVGIQFLPGIKSHEYHTVTQLLKDTPARRGRMGIYQENQQDMPFRAMKERDTAKSAVQALLKNLPDHQKNPLQQIAMVDREIAGILGHPESELGTIFKAQKDALFPSGFEKVVPGRDIITVLNSSQVTQSGSQMKTVMVDPQLRHPERGVAKVVGKDLAGQLFTVRGEILSRLSAPTKDAQGWQASINANNAALKMVDAFDPQVRGQSKLAAKFAARRQSRAAEEAAAKVAEVIPVEKAVPTAPSKSQGSVLNAFRNMGMVFPAMYTVPTACVGTKVATSTAHTKPSVSQSQASSPSWVKKTTRCDGRLRSDSVHSNQSTNGTHKPSVLPASVPGFIMPYHVNKALNGVTTGHNGRS